MVPLKTLIRNMKAKERNKEETKENEWLVNNSLY